MAGRKPQAWVQFERLHTSNAPISAGIFTDELPSSQMESLRCKLANCRVVESATAEKLGISAKSKPGKEEDFEKAVIGFAERHFSVTRVE